MQDYKNGLKSTLIGILLMIIGLAIFIISEYFIQDLKLISTSSILIFIFEITGILSLLGKDKLIDKFYTTLNKLIDRIKS